MPDSTETHRADPEDLSEGTQVRWDASGGTAYGEIEEVATSGTISAEPEGPTMEGSEDEPAYGVRVYDINSDGEWEETGTLTVHRAGALTVIDGFPEDRARRMEARGVGQEHRAIMEGAELRMSSDGERTTVQFMTESLARDGLVLDADGLDLSAYRENPVVLWQHGQDPRRGGQPIAKTVDISRNSDGYLATVEWYDDDFSQEIKRQVKEGYLNAASIGWRTEDLDWGEDPPRVAESDMTEFSIVSVPADAGALVDERSSKGGGHAHGMQYALQEIRRLRREVAVHVRGESLAGTLSDAIDEMSGEDTSSQDIQEEMADAAGISPSTVDEILSAEIECPPLERLEGFAEVLDINLDTIIAAAENDGCEYDRSRCGCAGTGATAPSPPNATGSDATGSGPAAEDRDAAQDRTRLVRLSDVKRLKEKRKQEKRKTIRTELKKQLGMA